MNESVKMRYKSVRVKLFTVVGILVEPIITAIVNPKVFIEASLSMVQPTIKVTAKIPVIPSSVPGSLFFRSILISSCRSHWRRGLRWITVESYFRNSTDLCGTMIITVKLKFPACINYISIVDLINGRYFLCRSPSISWKHIVEATNSKSFQEFSDTNLFAIVISLNPITKYFP